MRLTTLASAAALALSTAAIAQVATAPEEQKVPAGNDAEDGPPPAPNASSTPAPEPGTPSTALVNSVADEPGPVGQRPPK